MSTPADPLSQLLAAHITPPYPPVSVAVRRAPGARTETAVFGCTPATVFQAASISKPVAALATLALVSQGKLGLDDHVNDHLTTWKLPVPAECTTRVTVAHLLCHGGTLSVAAFPGYPRDAVPPTLAQILDGAPPANTPPVRVAGLPGLAPRYSGGGYTVLQQLLLDVTGRAYDGLITDLVLGPLGMTGAHFRQPGRGEAAVGHIGGTPMAGDWHVYPEQAAAGLWCTPSDLVAFAGAIQDMAAGQTRPPGQPWPLSKPAATATQMLTAQFPGAGLGLMLAGENAGRRFGHTGGNEGYACEMSATVAPGPVIAVMTASHEGDGLISALLPALRKHLAWPDPAACAAGPLPDERISFTALAREQSAYTGGYTTTSGKKLTLTANGANWTLTTPGQPPLAFELAEMGPPPTLRSPVLPVEAELIDHVSGKALLILRQDGPGNTDGIEAFHD